MSDERKTAVGCAMVIGFMMTTVALALSVGSAYGAGWGIAAFFLANGLFWIAVAVRSAMNAEAK